MTVEEALARTEDRRNRWVRLGMEIISGFWTFMCPKCNAWFTLVTRPRMPDSCPRCSAVLGQPPEPGT